MSGNPWWKENRQRHIEYCSKYYFATKGSMQHKKRKDRSRASRWKKDGLSFTLDQYQQSYALQEGKCVICQLFRPTLCVDHDHKTGKVRALLCRTCNAGLGDFRDNLTLLQRAILYL